MPGEMGGNGYSLNSAVFQEAPVYDACCRGFLPHHPARGDHRETSPSCDEDRLRPFGFWGIAENPGPAGSAAADAP